MVAAGIAAALHFPGRNEKTIRIGYSRYDYPPFHYKDGGDQPVGFDMELAISAAEKMNVKFEFVQIDWSQKEELLMSKEVDILWGGLERSTLDENKVKFTASYLQSGIVFVMKDDRNYSTWQDLQGNNICVLNFTPAYDYFQAYNRNVIQSSLVSTPPEYERLLQTINEHDCLIADSGFAAFFVKEIGNSYKISSNLISISFAAATRIEDTELFKSLQEALDGLKADGTIASLKKQWIN